MGWNVRSINNKVNNVMALVSDRDIDLIFISETWLTETHNNITATIRDHGYNIHHFHRGNRIGGGVAIIFKKLAIKS